MSVSVTEVQTVWKEADCLWTAQQVEESINADDVHKAHTSLVCLENTSNRGGGSCYELDEIRAIRQVCDDRGLALHLDGARLPNAAARATATRCCSPPESWCG
mgnify:CR=1 FL=1